MSEPLTREERERYARLCAVAEEGVDVLALGLQPEHVQRLLSALDAAEERADRFASAMHKALRKRRLDPIREALIADDVARGEG